MPTALRLCSAGSIFSLKWNKRNSPLNERAELTDDDKHHANDLCQKLDCVPCHMSDYKDAILGYIAGFIVKKVLNKISCPARAMCKSSLFRSEWK